MRIGYRKPEGQAKTERVTDIRKMTVREPWIHREKVLLIKS